MSVGERIGQRTRHDYLADSVILADARQDRMSVRFGLPAEPGWTRCADFLADPGAFPAWGAALADWLRSVYGEAPERTVSGYLMSWYLLPAAWSAGLLFHHERRVPSLRPADLAFTVGSPKPLPVGVALLSPTFVCLPDDPAAGTADATVVADEKTLATVLRGRFAAHAARFVTAFAPHTRFGTRTLWAAATDALDTALWLAGRYGGDEAAGALDAALILDDGPKPFTSPSTLRPDHGGDAPSEWTRRRESCCFYYLLDQPDGACRTCPRLSGRGTC